MDRITDSLRCMLGCHYQNHTEKVRVYVRIVITMTEKYMQSALYVTRQKEGNDMSDLFYVKKNPKLIDADVLDKIIAELEDEADYAYADFDRYKEDILHAEPDELPDDDFRYGMRRAIEIINKYKLESEGSDNNDNR